MKRSNVHAYIIGLGSLLILGGCDHKRPRAEPAKDGVSVCVVRETNLYLGDFYSGNPPVYEENLPSRYMVSEEEYPHKIDRNVTHWIEAPVFVQTHSISHTSRFTNELTRILANEDCPNNGGVISGAVGPFAVMSVENLVVDGQASNWVLSIWDDGNFCLWLAFFAGEGVLQVHPRLIPHAGTFPLSFVEYCRDLVDEGKRGRNE